MMQSKSRTRKVPRCVLALPDLEHAKTAVLTTLTSASGQRTYESRARSMRLPVLSSPPDALLLSRCDAWWGNQFVVAFVRHPQITVDHARRVTCRAAPWRRPVDR